MRGSIRETSPGRFLVQASGGFDEFTGRRRRVTRRVRGSRADAERALTRLLAELDAGTWADPGRVTLGRYLEERWLPHMSTRLRASTWERYRSLVRHHVIPRIGRVPLGKLRPAHVQAVVDGMLAAGQSRASALQAYRVLAEALRHAVRWQLLAQNPAAGASPPRPERRELVVLEASQIRALLEQARQTPWYVPLLLAAACGLRRGEALGLRWRDVELEERKIRVTATLQRVAGELRFEQPKTDRARRTVALPPFTASELRRHRREQAERRLLIGSAWRDHDLVADRGDGGPLDPESFTHAFARLARQAGLPAGVRLHDLRHAYATELLRAGVHPKVVSEALGHASPAFTMTVYQHVLPSMGEQAAAAIEAALGGSD